MTRKRYCKLIQSCGHSRNAAQASARSCRRRGRSYSQQWEMITKWRRIFVLAASSGHIPEKLLYRDGFTFNGRRYGP